MNHIKCQQKEINCYWSLGRWEGLGRKALGQPRHFSGPLSCSQCSLSNASVLASLSLNSLMKDKQLGQPREIHFMTSFSGGYV